MPVVRFTSLRSTPGSFRVTRSTDALHAALASLGSGTPDEAACRQVQRGLERLVLSPVPDRRDMARVVSALGGGARAGGPDEALAAFLDTLLAAVMEDL